jgi:hypothetical protein
MKRRMLLLASSVFGALSGCGMFATSDYAAPLGETGDPETYSDYTGWAYYDDDGDGFDSYEDCDDGDPDINPDAEDSEDCP